MIQAVAFFALVVLAGALLSCAVPPRAPRPRRDVDLVHAGGLPFAHHFFWYSWRLTFQAAKTAHARARRERLRVRASRGLTVDVGAP